jgi:sulfite reductase (ferredoxin)
MDRVGAGRVRFTAFQKLVILDVPADGVDDLVAGLQGLGLTATPSPFRRATMACTGIEFCKLAIVDTKDTATEVIRDLEQRLADVQLDRPIALNLNGCPNSCARIQTADIGLKGQVITVDGEQVAGYQVHLGGGLAGEGREEAGLGRTVRGLKVPATELADYVERLTRRFVAAREPDESFAQWAHRADEEALS